MPQPSRATRLAVLLSRRLVRRFRDDIRGIAAVEFGYVLPVLMLMLIGTAEITRAVAINRRMGQVTNSIADLVGREKTMAQADLNTIYRIADKIMSPYDSSSLKITVIPVQASSTNANTTKVYAATTNRPSHRGGWQPAKCAAYGLTSNLIPKGASVIVVETSYEFNPIILDFVLGKMLWSDKAVVSPRNSCVDFDGNKCVTTCFS